jgi:hypothetical protein
MKAKNILSIAAFFTAFAVSAAIASLFIPANTTDHRATSCFTNHSTSATANRITAFINRDVYNGREHTRIIYRILRDTPRVSEHSSYPEYVSAVNAYVETFPSMDVSEMPRDFRLAWRKHTKAWRDYSAFISSEKSVTVYGYYGDFELTEAAYTQEIDETWDEVINIARKHGSNARGY